MLPLRNIPVIHPSFTNDFSAPAVATAITEVVLRWDLDAAVDQFAVALDLTRKLDYDSLLELASGIKEFAAELPAEKALVIVIERDYAQALGQTIKGMMPERSLLVIDRSWPSVPVARDQNPSPSLKVSD